MKEMPPEIKQLNDYLAEFQKESDRGAALVAASMLDERLQEIISNFLVESPISKELMVGFNAPLGTLSARADAAFSLGLIQKHEYNEIKLIRKIRNEFGHDWKPVSFETGQVAALCRQLPWLGPADHEAGATERSRFNFAVLILLTDLLWRVLLVSKERRTPKVWPYTTRSR